MNNGVPDLWGVNVVEEHSLLLCSLLWMYSFHFTSLVRGSGCTVLIHLKTGLEGGGWYWKRVMVDGNISCDDTGARACGCDLDRSIREGLEGSTLSLVSVWSLIECLRCCETDWCICQSFVFFFISNTLSIPALKQVSGVFFNNHPTLFSFLDALP